MKHTITIHFLLLLASSCFANKFYSDPVNGNMNNDGSQARPWGSVQAIINGRKIEYYRPASADTTRLTIVNAGAPLKAGDTLMLLNGYQGELLISDMYNRQYIVIMANPGASATFRNISIDGGMRWELNGLYISPSYAPTYQTGVPILTIRNRWAPSYHMRIKNNTIFTVPDISAYTAADWISRIQNVAFNVDASYSEVSYNHIKNFQFGLYLNGNFSHAHHNLIENFSGDASRVLGDDCVYEFNTVKNVYAVDGEHRDMLQSYTNNRPGLAPVSRITVRNNYFIGRDGTINNALNNGDVQCIGLFDGFFDNWLVENNVIVTNHYHGVTFMGATNCVIRNNTIMGLNDSWSVHPWIWVVAHKDGRPSTNNTVVNNIVDNKVDWVSTGTNANNLIVGNKRKTDIFMNPAIYDLHLKKTSPAVDAGNASLAPARDYEERLRDVRPDIGAYEFIGTLPVTWGNFTAIATAGKTALTWITLQETDAATFSIEYSTDGKNFKSVESVPALNKASGATYSFVHQEPDVKLLNYYRIKQTDKNGAAAFSVIRTVAFANDNLSITLSPNPVKDVLRIKNQQKELLFIVTDANGRAVRQWRVAPGTHSVNLQQLPAGVYLLTAWDNNVKIYAQQVIKN